MRGGLQLWRNPVVAIAKLLAMPVTTIFLHDKLGVGLILVRYLVPLCRFSWFGSGCILVEPPSSTGLVTGSS